MHEGFPDTWLTKKIEEVKHRVRNYEYEREDAWRMGQALMALKYSSDVYRRWLNREDYARRMLSKMLMQLKYYEDVQKDVGWDTELAKELLILENKKHTTYRADRLTEAFYIAETPAERAKRCYERTKKIGRAVVLEPLPIPPEGDALKIVLRYIESLITQADMHWNTYRETRIAPVAKDYLKVEQDLTALGITLHTSKFGTKYEYRRAGRINQALDRAILNLESMRRKDEYNSAML